MKILIVLVIMFTACSPINRKLGLDDDNALEQVVEEAIDGVIESKIGVDPEVDLTP